MPAGRRRRIFAITSGFVALAGLAYAALLLTTWANRTEILVRSKALAESRKIKVFGHDGNGSANLVIYSLDGEKHRHALMPAAHSAFFAWASGQSRPLFVAVHDHGGRDTDLRPAKVKPAYWRPDISGRAAAFDIFLLQELRSEIEKRFGAPQRRFLFGHSLGGFYALDMPSRQSHHGFDGLFTFSPTFSHDLSLLDRLEAACISTPYIYANIGIESGRDTDVFRGAEKKVKAIPSCRGRFETVNHPGMIHAVVMVTGQLAAFQTIYAGGGT
jgi:predicted alpha/beta superfamily hydrolase